MTPRDLATALRLIADALELPSDPQSPQPVVVPAVVSSWRERIWTAHPSTRLSVVETAEACGKPKSWVYRRTGERCEANDRLPHRKLDGELTFVVGELRAWLEQHEEIVAQTQRPALVTSRHGAGS